MTKDLLIEIGTEELPPRNLQDLAKSLAQNVCNELAKAGLAMGQVKSYATPRRLAVLIRELAQYQPDRRQERRGPALHVAYDADGKPTQAAVGFARSCGVEVSDLQILETDKGAWLIHVTTEPGAATADILPTLMATALAELPVPKRMRWSDINEEFVRPVHWLVLLYGSEVIPSSIFSVSAGRETRGHRFHCPKPITLFEPNQYASLLEKEGHVIADFAVRRNRIRTQAEAAAQEVAGQAVIDATLLDEVTALVEWPVALLGHFEQRFLNVPSEVLVSTMQDHQKYFPVRDSTGRLLPYFITIANLESKDPDQIRAGNERVIRPRFSDAEFFWLQDRKQPLAERIEALKFVVFQQQLGSLHEKGERVSYLARFIAEHSGGNADWAERAARLAKCDLLTQMVQEFPELQGVMGRYYAQYDGEAEEIAQAQEEQYLPRYAGDELPRTGTGRAVALADRLDTLVGIFAIGQAPTGTKDPFALRRAALGILRILIECEIHLDLKELLQQSAKHFPSAIAASTAVPMVFDFCIERLRSYYAEQNFSPDTFEAVLECFPTMPLEFDKRIRALAAFRKLPEAERLAAANKRIRNILKKLEGELPFQVKSDLLEEEAERFLAAQVTELSAEVLPLMRAGFYREALMKLAALQEPVDRFFDQVMVMVDQVELRNNRIALLNQLHSLFMQVADFSRLQP